MSTAAQPITSFDPDAFMAQRQKQPQGQTQVRSQEQFDPDAFMANRQNTPAAKPTALQRFSEVTLGTQHPIDEAVREGKDIYQHPAEAAKSVGEMAGIPREIWSNPSVSNVGRLGGSGIPGMVFGEQGLLRDPIGFGERITGANQAAEDVRNNNWKAVPGSIAGGLTNLATLKKPVEAGAGAVREGLQNAGQVLAEKARTPKGQLTPKTKVVASLGGGLLGHQLGIPGVGELGGLFKGPAVADALIPRRTPKPTMFGSYEEPPVEATRDQFYGTKAEDLMRRGRQEEALQKQAARTEATTARTSQRGGSNLSNRFILTPDEWAAKDTIQDIAKRQASERGMLYAGGMRPGKLTPAPPTAEPGLRGNPTPFQRLGGAPPEGLRPNAGWSDIAPQPTDPREAIDMSQRLGRTVSTGELPGLRRRLDAERNIGEGLAGNRRDTTGEIREAHRATLDPPAKIAGVLKETGFQYMGRSGLGITELKQPGTNISVSVLDKDLDPATIRTRIAAKLNEFGNKAAD